jgi:hypothetical protein
MPKPWGGSVLLEGAEAWVGTTAEPNDEPD